MNRMFGLGVVRISSSAESASQQPTCRVPWALSHQDFLSLLSQSAFISATCSQSNQFWFQQTRAPYQVKLCREFLCRLRDVKRHAPVFLLILKGEVFMPFTAGQRSWLHDDPSYLLALCFPLRALTVHQILYLLCSHTRPSCKERKNRISQCFFWITPCIRIMWDSWEINTFFGSVPDLLNHNL